MGYLGTLTFEPNEDVSFREAFRVTGTAGIMAYVLGMFPHAIWFGRSGRNVLMDLIDGVVYGAITGLIFGLLWPTAEALPVVG